MINVKRYEVEYWIKHKREFWVEREEQIGEILCNQNECRILSIVELPVDNAFRGEQ